MLDTEYIKNRYSGILVVGDIHGDEESMWSALQFASINDLFFMSLGDIVDYGAKNYECSINMGYFVERQKGAMVIGNHDFKFWKYICQRAQGEIKVQVKGGMVSTVNQFEKSDEGVRQRWIDDFEIIMRNSAFHYVIDNMMFVHGGAHKNLWSTKSSSSLPSKLRSRALFGQIDPVNRFNEETGYPNRIYDWIDDVNNNEEPKLIFVGHDIQSKDAPVIKSSLDGTVKVCFMDTGCSKGGKLSGMVLKRDKDFKWNLGKVLNFS